MKDKINLDYKKFLDKHLSKSIIPKNKKILIVGSSGFIGHNLVLGLLNQNSNKNNKIYGTDIIKARIKDKNYFFKKIDLYNNKKNFFTNIKFDYIINLAGIPSPVDYKKKPLETIFLNYDLSKKLLMRSLKDKSQFIYFSSSEIYGDPDYKNIPTKENYNGNVSPVSDRSVYDESKRMGETITNLYKNKFKVKCKIIRPFNFYGQFMNKNDQRSISKFFNSAKKNLDITVYGNGKQTRTYCNIKDAIIIILHIIFKGKNFIYNVASDANEISAYNLAKMIKSLSKSKSKINLIGYPSNYPSDEPIRRNGSMSLFNKEFNYKTKISLKDGLKNLNEIL